MQILRLTCFLGEGLNHITGRSTPCTIARPDFHKILGVRQKVLQPGRVFLASNLNSVCSCFFVMGSPVPNLQTCKLSKVFSWFRHFSCKKFFSTCYDTIDDGWASDSQMLLAVSFLSVLDYGKAHNADLIKDVESKLKPHFKAWNSHTQMKKEQKTLHKVCSQNIKLVLFRSIWHNNLYHWFSALFLFIWLQIC